MVLDVAVVGGVSLALGLFRLGTPSIWVDESFTARAMHSSVATYIEGYHWLYYSILRPWSLVAGTSEWALRFPSVVAAMIAAALVVVLGRKLFDRWVGLVAGLLLATNPFVVQWSQQARGYTFLLALATLATLLLLRALESGTRREWALYGLAFAAVIVWHPVGGLLLVAPHAVLAYQRRDRILPHGLLAAVLVCALGVPWAAQIAMRSTGEGVAMDWLTAPSLEVATQAFLDVSGATGLGALLAGLGLWVLHRRTGVRDEGVWLATWALAPFVLALLVTTVRPIFLDRYLMVAAPAFALLAGVAVMGVGRRLRVVLLAADCRVDGGRARAVVLDERRQLAWGGLEERRAERARAASRGGRSRRRSVVIRARGAVLRRGGRRRLDRGLDLGDHLVRDRGRHHRSGAPRARLRRSRPHREAAVRLARERAALAAARLTLRRCGSGRVSAARAARRSW